MRWIRCNNCYVRAEAIQEPFNLTKCGHTFCSQCIAQAAKQCPICNTVEVPTICLQKPLEPHIALYFTPLKENLQQLVNVTNFQEEQVSIMAKRFCEMEKKYSYMKQIFRNTEIGIKKLRENNKRDKEEAGKIIRNLKNENIALKFALDRTQNSPCKTLLSNPSSASSGPIQERYKENNPRVTFVTPMSVNSGNISSFTNSGRQYLSSLAQSDRTSRMSTIKSAASSSRYKSFVNRGSTGMSGLPKHLESMTMTNF